MTAVHPSDPAIPPLVGSRGTGRQLGAPQTPGRETAIGRRLGEHASRYKVRKHFAIGVRAARLVFERNPDSITTQPTRLRRKAFDLLSVDPNQTVPITVTG